MESSAIVEIGPGNAASPNLETPEHIHTKQWVQRDHSTTQQLHTAVRTRTRLQRISLLLYGFWFCLQCLLCYAILMLLLAPLLPFTLIFYSLKILERVLVKMNSKAFHLSGMDAMLAKVDKRNPPIINAVLCMENEGSIEQAVNNFHQAILERLIEAKKENRELLYPRVRCFIRPG